MSAWFSLPMPKPPYSCPHSQASRNSYSGLTWKLMRCLTNFPSLLLICPQAVYAQFEQYTLWTLSPHLDWDLALSLRTWRRALTSLCCWHTAQAFEELRGTRGNRPPTLWTSGGDAWCEGHQSIQFQSAFRLFRRKQLCWRGLLTWMGHWSLFDAFC